MKSISLFCLMLLTLPVVAQEEKPDANAMTPSQKAFLNLPEEKRIEFVNHLSEAKRLFQQKRIFETMEEVDKANAIFSENAEVYNLRGSCYVEMRAFDKSLVEFYKAIEHSKDNPSILFNVGEVYFVSKNWQKALDTFQKTIALIPEDNVALGRLIEFKILLCKKKLGHDDVATLAEKYDFMDDSPYHFFAQAALAYDAEDLVKAEEWLAIAARIFRDPNVLAPWQDTLVEYGYIKSFYGEDDTESSP
ncbi:MAG: tetratricopeptide repeat protein [Luteolibacter sp.]